MPPVAEGKLPPGHQAKARFVEAMDNWDEDGADARCGHAELAEYVDIDRRAATDLRGDTGADARARVEHASRRQADEVAVRAGPRGDVADQVAGAEGVVERHGAAAEAHGDEVRHRLAGRHVDVRGAGHRFTGREHGDEPATRRGVDRDVLQDRGGVG